MSRFTAPVVPVACAALLALLLSAPAPVFAQVEPPSDAMDAALAAYEAGDLKTAAKGFGALSAKRQPLADYNLAMMHLRGELPRPDPQIARRLLERAAAAKLVRAELALGQLYEQGVLGKPDLAKANQWYERAAAHGSADAQVALATAFYLGRGAARDMSRAAHWFREAAKGGDVGALPWLLTFLCSLLPALAIVAVASWRMRSEKYVLSV